MHPRTPLISTAIKTFKIAIGLASSVFMIQGIFIGAPASASQATTSRILIVVAGQSNASGWESYATDPNTGTNFLTAPFANGADANSLITWMPWGVKQGAGATPVPLDTPQPKSQQRAIFGPEIGFARRVWKHRSVPVIVVKCASPGSSLAVNWNPESQAKKTPDILFALTVKKVKAVIAADAANGQNDILGGFVWFQGESDAKVPVYAAAYQANLTNFIARIRSALPFAPSAPFGIIKEDSTRYINSRESRHASPALIAAMRLGNSQVRAADDVVAANVANVVEVDSAGLARNGHSQIHLTNRSQLSVGAAMARAMEDMIP